jgi:hypothetical protein
VNYVHIRYTFAAPPLSGEALGAISPASLERGGGTAVPEGLAVDMLFFLFYYYNKLQLQ